MDWTKEYRMFHVNIESSIGRGLLLYVQDSLYAEEAKLSASFEEQLFVKIKINSTDYFLVGLIYRSPSDNTEEKNECLRNLITEASKMKCKHYLIMGDFNYPNIDWDLLCTKSENSAEQKFIDCLQDNFMFQTVTKPTRWRGTNIPTILDLVITKDENAVEDMEYQSPLGKSDHCVICFKYVCRAILKSGPKKRKTYRKANFAGMKKEISETDWESILESQSTVNEMWRQFRQKIEDIEDKYVPVVTIRPSRKTKMPLDKETVTLIKEKNALCRKYVATKDPNIRKKYNRTRNKVAKFVRKARKSFEKSIAQEAKTNPKKIWQYINSKSKTRQGIGELCVDPKNPKSNKTEVDEEKANILAVFFSSVFTQEPEEAIPELDKRPIKKEWTELRIL
ncbi:uncharacterized protein LOC133205026 [Saccostrea echinata]|uniref:uncharacterized protein LOC133205026 n=1 Tax=Saccostrea echinata TaxID=191078 RepID=UPI002A8384E6|nr:uncharacterized protein LOC133205026 [Saccostrea echinata]